MKLQGSSHKVLPSVSLNNKTNVVPNGTMVVGADVTHPGPFSDGCPSIAAIVATTNEEAYHFLGSARLQKSKGEVGIFSFFLSVLLTSASTLKTSKA